MRSINLMGLAFLVTVVACTAGEDDKPHDSGADDSGDPGEPAVFSGERTVLFEVFTGSTCGPCNGADAQLDSVLKLEENDGRWVAIKYQVGSDPYITAEAYNRAWSYLSVDGTYSIPNVVADGTNVFHPVEINDDVGFTQANFDSYADVFSPL